MNKGTNFGGIARSATVTECTSCNYKARGHFAFPARTGMRQQCTRWNGMERMRVSQLCTSRSSAGAVDTRTDVAQATRSSTARDRQQPKDTHTAASNLNSPQTHECSSGHAPALCATAPLPFSRPHEACWLVKREDSHWGARPQLVTRRAPAT
jgi:hypothetical protein